MSAFTGTSISRRARIRGWRWSSCKIRPIPYHDWNERITAECYAPNSVARVLDADGRIARLVNNYSRISFNFGPTLLAWLEAERAGRLPARARCRSREPGAVQRPWLGACSGLQSHHHAACQQCGQGDAGRLGHCAISGIASGASPKGCGWRRRPWISPRSRCWPSMGSGSPCWRPSQAARVRPVGIEGMDAT